LGDLQVSRGRQTQSGFAPNGDWQNALSTRFSKSADVEDLNQAIAEREGIRHLITEIQRERYLFLLAEDLSSRFIETGSISDSETAIKIYEDIGRNVDGPVRAMYLDSLGSVFQTRALKTLSAVDVDRAIAAGKSAATCKGVDPVGRAMLLVNLARAFEIASCLKLSEGDLNDAVKAYEEALTHSRNNSIIMGHLGETLINRFRRYGRLNDLKRGLKLSKAAVDATQNDEDSSRIVHLTNFAAALRTQFEVSGSQDDLAEAITTNRLAVRSAYVGHPYYNKAFNQQCVLLQISFSANGSIDDLNEAIEAGQKSLRSGSASDAHVNDLHDLATAFQRRYD
jgi:tetratricopeptide (TPR) repeat protein